jgi:hypothetical protein
MDRAVPQVRSQLCAHLAEELAVYHGDRCKDGFGQVAEILEVLDERRARPAIARSSAATIFGKSARW